MTVEELNKLKDERPTLSERVDINDIEIDMNASVEKRAEQYLSQVKNPYHFRCGDIAVNVEFTEGGKPLRECIKSYLMGQRRKGEF
ncbi:MAG: hypothetical protein LBL98_02530 [Ruminococcus sp.]|nr:hypothetical protein [Ruminococcus sp.]